MPTDAEKLRVYRQSLQTRWETRRKTQEQRRRAAYQAVQEAAATVFCLYPSLQRAYLFGSVTHPGAFHAESDIDIAVEGLAPQTYFDLWRELESVLPQWPIDLRDISAPSSFADVVRKTESLSMKVKIRQLQAEFQSDLESIAEAYQLLDTATLHLAHETEQGIVVGYYLNVIYGLFENLFQRISFLFGDHMEDDAHAELLHRMTLEIREVRPPVIRKPTYACLDELRKFRHLFRNAYVLHFDLHRLNLVIEKARTLQTLYQDVSRLNANGASVM